MCKFYNVFSRSLKLNQKYPCRVNLIIFLIALFQISFLITILSFYGLKNVTEIQQKNNYSKQIVLSNTVPQKKPQVLLFAEQIHSQYVTEIISIIQASKISYSVELIPRNISSLIGFKKGVFQVIVFERINSYVNMDPKNKRILHQYCLKHSVGLLIFAHPEEKKLNFKETMFSTAISQNGLLEYKTVTNSSIFRITKGGMTDHGTIPYTRWTIFSVQHKTYQPLVLGKRQYKNDYVILVLEDRGYLDGIRKIFFGHGLKYWLNIIIFLDGISYLSNGIFKLPLERYILIDIDDIFVGKIGTRLKPHDVKVSKNIINILDILLQLQ